MEEDQTLGGYRKLGKAGEGFRGRAASDLSFL